MFGFWGVVPNGTVRPLNSVGHMRPRPTQPAAGRSCRRCRGLGLLLNHIMFWGRLWDGLHGRGRHFPILDRIPADASQPCAHSNGSATPPTVHMHRPQPRKKQVAARCLGGRLLSRHPFARQEAAAGSTLGDTGGRGGPRRRMDRQYGNPSEYPPQGLEYPPQQMMVSCGCCERCYASGGSAFVSSHVRRKGESGGWADGLAHPKSTPLTAG